MARYTGAVCRLCRRSGEKLMLKGAKCFTPKCTIERRPKPPGQQAGGRRPRISDRGLQLREKQKGRYIYGMLERQFRRFFSMAEKQPGVTGDSLLVLLERRLDNVVYRLGFADSRAQARQLVCHGHILVSGRKTDSPSCLVKEGNTIGWRKASANSEYYKEAVANIKSKTVPSWLSLDREGMVGRVVSVPTPEEIGAQFETMSIVEYYAR